MKLKRRPPGDMTGVTADITDAEASPPAVLLRDTPEDRERLDRIVRWWGSSNRVRLDKRLASWIISALREQP